MKELEKYTNFELISELLRREAPENQKDYSKEQPKQFDAKCAECGCDTKVPFKPWDGAHITCTACYKKSKGGNSGK